jgi:hypothetical protein
VAPGVNEAGVVVVNVHVEVLSTAPCGQEYFGAPTTAAVIVVCEHIWPLRESPAAHEYTYPEMTLVELANISQTFDAPASKTPPFFVHTNGDDTVR